MDIADQFKLGHLLLSERKCRVCGQTKNLIDGFYRTRKDRGAVSSSYSYECKECTKKRIINSRKTDMPYESFSIINDFYPDW
tara:strand:- start:347 stop:592 length:246 start_codon:yes stop_codon:yes gene_type:complete